MMELDTALSILRGKKEELAQKYGVTRIGIFGSTARGEATPDSDIDIVVEMPPDLFMIVDMKEELEEILAIPVDIIRIYKYMNRLLKKRIDREAVYV